MSILSDIKRYFTDRKQLKIEKNLLTLKNAKAIKEDRQMALQFFSEYPDADVAVPALLERFEYSLEHGINDTREKESSYEAIIQHKEKALPYVREKLKASTRIAWPIKILKALSEEATLLRDLIDALDFSDTAFDEGKVNKNYDILCYLRDYQLPQEVKRLAHFLNDPDERVRFACVELLIEQDAAEVPGLLERYLKDKTSENTRLHRASVEAFLAKGWKVAAPDQFAQGHVVDNIFINNKGILEVRGRS